MRKSVLLLVFIILLHHLALEFNHDDNNRQSFASPAIMITEVEFNPSGADSGQKKVEIYNPSDSPADRGAWTVSSSGGANGARINYQLYPLNSGPVIQLSRLVINNISSVEL